MGVLEVLEDECVGEGDEPHLRGVGDVGGRVLEDRGVPAGAGAVFDVQIVLRGRRGGAEPELSVVCHCIFPDLSGPDDGWRNLGTPRGSEPAAGMRLCLGCCSAGDLRMLVLFSITALKEV